MYVPKRPLWTKLNHMAHGKEDEVKWFWGSLPLPISSEIQKDWQHLKTWNHSFIIHHSKSKLSNMSKSSNKSRDDKLRSKKRLNQLWTRSRTRSRIASLCQICQSWSRCIFCLLMFSISDNTRFSHFIKYPYQKISRLDCICFTGDGQQVWSRSSIFGECERFQRKTYWWVG